MHQTRYKDGFDFSAEVLAEMEIMAYGKSSAAAAADTDVDPDPARDDDDPGFDFPLVERSDA